MPTDPRQAEGVCQNADPWTGSLSAWQTGGAGAGTIAASATAGLGWPPVSISNAGAATLLPTYTPTGPVPTLPPPTFTLTGSGATATAGDGWANPSDTAGLMVPISTCSYLDPWIGSANPPSPLCGGVAARGETEDAAVPLMTPAPS
jgi:glucan 1,3-beta-glucosidase